ncbi:MAG: hypothetical protein P8J45_03045 [Phycisphaerales bacterium]|nr:hypothetical protein [Phycisphaerales bacterium]
MLDFQDLVRSPHRDAKSAISGRDLPLPKLKVAGSIPFARFEAPGGDRSPAIRCRDRKAFEDEQIGILATPPFSHRILRGHDHIELGSALDRIDGVKVRNVAHARKLIRDHEGEFIEIVFSDKYIDGALILDAKALTDATQDVLEQNSIRKAASPGQLLDVVICGRSRLGLP